VKLQKSLKAKLGASQDGTQLEIAKVFVHWRELMIDQTVHFLESPSEAPEEGYITISHGPTYRKGPYLIDGILSVGRDPSNHIVIRDPYVSSKHCQFEKRPMGFFIRDLKSKNGLTLNGVRVREAELSPGSEVCLGSARLTFQTYFDKTEETITSKNANWLEQLQRLPSVAQSDLPLFLQGESGTGKEVIATAVHKLSHRRSFPIVSVNCSALTESLVESELFGHVKGSFTGATSDRKGAFEAARGGTLFLDEIGDLPLFLQPKLLRAIENNEIRPVGSDKVVSTNIRIITATHKNLERLVAAEEFRSDLYFRVNVVKVNIPPLRKRMEDFEDLLNSFSKENKVSFSVAATAQMKSHLWPGNIRELKNTVARARALFPQVRIEAAHLKHLLTAPAASPKPQEKTTYLQRLKLEAENQLPLLKEVEKEMIEARLLANGYNQRRTAIELGIPKSTLHDRIRAYNICTRIKPL
jgi:transcriptional regulator with GAF, ATPase, and Fis domain